MAEVIIKSDDVPAAQQYIHITIIRHDGLDRVRVSGLRKGQHVIIGEHGGPITEYFGFDRDSNELIHVTEHDQLAASINEEHTSC